MSFVEVLVEGAADVPVVKELLERYFGLSAGPDFRIIPHQGKGSLPGNPLARPEPHRRGLLDQLPAKLRGYAHLPPDFAIVVLVDADSDDCRRLKSDLVAMLAALPACPPTVLFRIAVEETESWFLAQPDAVAAAYPRADVRKLAGIQPDAVVGAWERLTYAIGQKKPEQCTGADKHEWATRIAPYLNFDVPISPSLSALVEGLKRVVPVP